MERTNTSYNNWLSPEENPKYQKDAVQPGNEKTMGSLGEIVIGQRIEAFFSEVSVVGLKYVVLTGAMYVRKAIWLLCVLGGLGFMIYQFHDRISYFLSNPTTVTVQVKNVDELEFPAVTICNENLISRSIADALPGFTDLITKIYPPWPIEDFEPDFDTVYQLEETLNITDWGLVWLLASPFIDPEQWQHCTFSGRACNLSEIEIVPTQMGFCLRFNGEKVNYTVTDSGSSYGLWMVLNISQNDYMYSLSRNAGVRITVHQKQETPAISQHGIKASPGFVTSIGVNKKVITDLPKPYTNCSDEKDYSYAECWGDCFEAYVIKHCHCRMSHFDDVSVRTCNPEERFTCGDVYSGIFVKDKLADQLCTCPKQCQTTKYLPVISSAAASEYSMETIAGNHYSCDPETCEKTEEQLAKEVTLVKRDMLEIEVYFQDLQVEEVLMQKAYTTLALLCDIGGALGLILGATILTVFEIVDFALVLLYDWIRYKIAQRQSKKIKAKQDVQTTEK